MTFKNPSQNHSTSSWNRECTKFQPSSEPRASCSLWMRFKSPNGFPSSQEDPGASGRVTQDPSSTQGSLFSPLPGVGINQYLRICVRVGLGRVMDEKVRGKVGEKEGKINGEGWDDIIAPFLCHQLHSNLSHSGCDFPRKKALLIPELSQLSLGLKTREKGHSRPCDIPLVSPSTGRDLGKQCFLFFPVFLFTFHPLGIFLSLISFLQSCFYPSPYFSWRKTRKAEPKPLGTRRFRDQNLSFHYLFYLS